MILSYHGITPQISPSAYIQQSSHIVGDVHIKDESSVWFNAVVRSDVCYIRIGRRVNIQNPRVRNARGQFRSVSIGLSTPFAELGYSPIG
jgi:carbonic anhydrase/acetyltransferase-like protein (isoleucine patch superfamily)